MIDVRDVPDKVIIVSHISPLRVTLYYLYVSNRGGEGAMEVARIASCIRII